MLATVDSLHRRRGRRKTRTRRGQTPVSRAYFRDLSRLNKLLFRDIRDQIVSQIPRWVREEEEEDRTSDAVEDDIDFLIAQLREKYSSPALLLQYRGAAQEAGNRTEKVNGVQTEAQLSRLGIDLFRETPQLQRLLTRFTRRNTALIVSIPQQTLGQVQQQVEAGVQGGLRATEIARNIMAVSTPEGATSSELQKAENRAALIARDQVLTFSSQLSKARQQENGVTSFIWRTVGDGRVRDLHEPRDGVEYTWADGAGGGDPFPGSGVNCRCSSEPVL